jgi:D-alanyl-D-alanine dipeptidase
MRGSSRGHLGHLPRISLRSIRATSLLSLLASASGHAAERPAAFVDAATLIPSLAIEMRYAGAHNFVGAPIDGYERPACLLTRPAAAALAEVQRDLAASRLGLKAFDCYRPARAVAHFVRWARDIRDVKTKAEFYPTVDKRDLFALGYIAAQSGHSRGSTVDIGIVKLGSNGELGGELDMGTPFDTFSPRSWPGDQNVSAEARRNRALLAAAMRRRGFRPYEKEWWHFTLRGEPFPATYFDFPVR